MPYQRGSQRGSLWRRSPQTGSDFQSLNTVVFQNPFCKGFLWIKYETCVELLDNRELIVHYNSNLSMVLPSAKEVLKNSLSNEMALSGQKQKRLCLLPFNSAVLYKRDTLSSLSKISLRDINHEIKILYPWESQWSPQNLCVLVHFLLIKIPETE